MIKKANFLIMILLFLILISCEEKPSETIFDEQGNIKQQIFESGEEKIIKYYENGIYAGKEISGYQDYGYWIKKYDEKNRLIDSYSYFSTPPLGPKRTLYFYGENDMVVEEQHFVAWINEPDLISTTKYYYDEQGNLIRKIMYDPEGKELLN